MLRDVIGADTTLGSEKLRTLLMMVMRNATTDSPWPLSNNPKAKYNEPARVDCNLKLPLWQLVRASTAAPTYFPPEVVRVGRDFIFVDGAVTMFNNPAFQLFLMATSEPYRLVWPTGEDNMLLISVGTGASANANNNLSPGRDEPALLCGHNSLRAHGRSAPRAGFSMPHFREMLRSRISLDREIGNVIGQGIVPMCQSCSLMLAIISSFPAKVWMRSAWNTSTLSTSNKSILWITSVKCEEVGRTLALQKVKAEHFTAFPPPS